MRAKAIELKPEITPERLKVARATLERLRAGKLTKKELERRERWNLEQEEAQRTGVVALRSGMSE